MAPQKAGSVREAAVGSADPSGDLPQYVAIIMDGNGRWAKEHGVSAARGHAAGADTVKERIRDAARLGIRELTLYSFSTENWGRSRAEVSALMTLFNHRIRVETPEMQDQGVRIRFLGRRGAPLSEKLIETMNWSEAETAGGDRITVFVALNYGGRAEIIDAARTFTGSTEAEFRAHLYAPDMHDPDLIIRTSGERRLSNYLLWQSAYSELIFRDELWPDFTRAAFEQSLAEFSERRRRFGGR
jgi:undecaprenyl diphosphate synthase